MENRIVYYVETYINKVDDSGIAYDTNFILSKPFSTLEKAEAFAKSVKENETDYPARVYKSDEHREAPLVGKMYKEGMGWQNETEREIISEWWKGEKQNV